MLNETGAGARGPAIVLDFRDAPAAAGFTPAPAARTRTAPRAAAPPVQARRVQATYGARFVAWLIDGAIVGVLSLVVGTVLMLMLAPLMAASDTGAVIFLLLALTFLPYMLAAIGVTFVYSVRLLARPGSRNGQTYGKQVMDIRVVRDDGRPIDGASAAMREVVWRGLVLGIGGSFLLCIPTLLDYLWPLWDDRGRTLHDMAAGTTVVRA
jgi:uncharacterized RDD family membrane protein YckC